MVREEIIGALRNLGGDVEALRLSASRCGLTSGSMGRIRERGL